MPQLPSLSNLFLGMPTAGNTKKERGKEKQKEKEEKRKEKAEKEKYDVILSFAEPFWQIRKSIMKHHNVDSLTNNATIHEYLRKLIEYQYTRYFMATWLKLPAFSQMWRWHDHFCKVMHNGELDPAAHNPLRDSLEMEKLLKDEFDAMAKYLFLNYVMRNDADGSLRSKSDMVRILNDERSLVALIQAVTAAFVNHFPTKEEPFLVRTKHYWLRLQHQIEEGEKERLRLAYEAEQAELAAQPRPARAPKPAQAPAAPKSNAEFEANKEKHDARVKKEAEEELARKAAHDAEVAKSRAEANAKAKREEEERADALRRQEESNKGGSSAPWQQEPLSPGAAAKQIVEVQEALEAKTKDIEAQRERIRLQVEAKKKEMAEQQRLADEMERALKVANVYHHAAAAPKKEDK